MDIIYIACGVIIGVPTILLIKELREHLRLFPKNSNDKPKLEQVK